MPVQPGVSSRKSAKAAPMYADIASLLACREDLMSHERYIFANLFRDMSVQWKSERYGLACNIFIPYYALALAHPMNKFLVLKNI
jgi:hypothetical protein